MASNPAYAHTRGPRTCSIPVSKGTHISMLVKRMLSACAVLSLVTLPLAGAVEAQVAQLAVRERER